MLAILTFIALAPSTGGSFSAEAEAQIPTLSAGKSEGGFGLRALDCLLVTEQFTALPAKAGSGEAEALLLLAALPPGLMRSVARLIGPCEILLCGNIETRSPELPASPRGLTCRLGGVNAVLIDQSSGAVSHTLAHELCHLVCRALDEAAKIDPSKWNEADLRALNPEGFAYYGAYFDGLGRPYSEAAPPEYTFEADPENAYFINRYSKTFPAEDAATIAEAFARLGPDSLTFKNAHIKRKLDYFLDAVEYYLLDGEKRL